MKKKLNIIKIGGNVIDDTAALNQFLADFVKVPHPKILVHGGGKLATDLANKMGISQVLWQGRRITDAGTLKIAVMVYAGWINKNIVASLNAKGEVAIGITGADLSILKAEKRNHPEIDFGFVGDISPASVNTEVMRKLLDTCGTLVFAPITADASGQLLNTNADTIASTLAVSLASTFEVQLNFCFEKPGVLREAEDENSFVSRLNLSLYRQMKSEDRITRGMIPKLDNSFQAIQSGVQGVYIGHFKNLLKMIACDEDAGTCIV
ncbi:MAG: acetylglutamate kinase [Bacteroidia bacterium]|nr:acetylglutamate kinase [Bacteroidia bacterium]